MDRKAWWLRIGGDDCISGYVGNPVALPLIWLSTSAARIMLFPCFSSASKSVCIVWLQLSYSSDHWWIYHPENGHCWISIDWRTNFYELIRRCLMHGANYGNASGIIFLYWYLFAARAEYYIWDVKSEAESFDKMYLFKYSQNIIELLIYQG